MADSVELNGVLKRLDNGALANHLLEDLRSEFSRDNLVFHELGQEGETVSHWTTYYRCFLPDLAGFAGSNCTAPHLIIG